MTKACPFYISSDISKKIYPQLLVLVHHPVPFTKMTLQNWTHGCGPACWHQLGITVARYLAWMEQQNTDAVGLRWVKTLVCYMHRSSLEVSILCCNFTPRTVDPQDSRMEHQRTAETRATSPHFGNCAAKIFAQEKF